MRPPPLPALAALLSVPAALSRPAAAQCSRVFGPMDAEFRTSQSILYNQIWSQVARGTNGWMFAWSEGQDVWARAYNSHLVAGPQFKVNATLDVGIQDEPAICANLGGNYLIAWSDRNGYDGSAMGVFGRVYNQNGIPLTVEFLIPSFNFQSQWRPLIAPTPSGGWVVAWSGDSDGNAYFRILDSNGAFLTQDIQVNTFVFDAQVDPAPAVATNGNIFIAFVDYSSHGGVGTGTNLWGRVFDSTGVPLQAQEFVLTTFTSNGDQRNPRVAADGLGRFFVVWDDQFFDGWGSGIFARAFNSFGTPLVTEYQVNSTTTNDQRLPSIVIDSLGRSIVSYEDYSLGWPASRIRARRFNGQGNPLGTDFLVNESPSSGTVMPCMAMDAAGEEIMIAFEGPGAVGNGQDVFAKYYSYSGTPQSYCTAKVNSRGCYADVSYSGTPSVSSPNPFYVTCGNVLSNKLGLMFYGYDASFNPFLGATVCIAAPLKRIGAQMSGGVYPPTDCSGTFSYDFNARIQSGVDPNLVSGSTVCARWFYRDGQDPAGYGIGLSDAIRFVICP